LLNEINKFSIIYYESKLKTFKTKLKPASAPRGTAIIPEPLARTMLRICVAMMALTLFHGVNASFENHNTFFSFLNVQNKNNFGSGNLDTSLYIRGGEVRQVSSSSMHVC